MHSFSSVQLVLRFSILVDFFLEFPDFFNLIFSTFFFISKNICLTKKYLKIILADKYFSDPTGNFGRNCKPWLVQVIWLWGYTWKSKCGDKKITQAWSMPMLLSNRKRKMPIRLKRKLWSLSDGSWLGLAINLQVVHEETELGKGKSSFREGKMEPKRWVSAIRRPLTKLLVGHGFREGTNFVKQKKLLAH